MIRLLKKILLLIILINLKIAVILGDSMFSTFLRICKVILDTFNLPAQHLSNESPTTGENSTQTAPDSSNPGVTASVQTEEECIQTVPPSLEGPPSTGDSSTRNITHHWSTQTIPYCSNPRVSASVQTEESFQAVPRVLEGPSFTGDSSTRNIPHCCSSKVSTSVQREESSKQLGNFENQCSTDIIIFNLNSSQKLVITQEKSKSNQCECRNAATEMSTTGQAEIKASATGFYGSNSSNMSIESDVIDSKIETGCSSFSASSDENASQNDGFSSQPVEIQDFNNEALAEGDEDIFKNIDNSWLNSLNDTFNISLDFENFESDPSNTFVKCEDPTINEQKTSSPLNKFPSPQNVCSNTSKFDVEQSQITQSKVAEIGTNTENWGRDSLSTSFKRRLSLPVKLNTTNNAAINFKLAQKELIEEALKNTSRHEKSFKEIKYPFSSEISLDGKSNDETDEKGVFSCSSYESLPVSDHLRNACNNNTLLSLYSENLYNEENPDFSSIDNLVGKFSEMKSNLLVPNLAQSKVIPSAKSGADEIKEEPDAIIRVDDFKDSNLINDKNGATKLCSEISLSTSVTDMCNILDKFVSSEVKLSSNRILNFDDNSGNNEQSGINDSGRTLSASNENTTSDNSISEQESEEKLLNQIKFKFSSPLKSVFSDLDEWSDEEHSLPFLVDRSEMNKLGKLDNLDEMRQQSYHKIVFIDESPPQESTRMNQNASNSCQATFLNKKPTFRNQNEKPKLRPKPSMKSKAETNKCAEYNYGIRLLPVLQRNEGVKHNSLLPIQQRDKCAEYNSFLPDRQRDNCAEYDDSTLPVRQRNECAEYDNSFLPVQQRDECAEYLSDEDFLPVRQGSEGFQHNSLLPIQQGDKCVEYNSFLPVRQRDDCAEYDNSTFPVQQRDECAEYLSDDDDFLPVRQRENQSFRESTETSKNKRDRMIRISNRYRWRESRPKWTGACENKVKTKGIFHFSYLHAQQSESLIETIPQRRTEDTNQNTLETNCQNPQSAPAEQSTSSGDSTSDNSVVTVKDLQEMK